MRLKIYSFRIQNKLFLYVVSISIAYPALEKLSNTKLTYNIYCCNKEEDDPLLAMQNSKWLTFV